MADDPAVKTALSKTKRYVTEQQLRLDTIQKLLINTKKKGVDNLSIGYLQERLSSLTKAFEHATNTHATILSLLDDDISSFIPYIRDDVWGQIKGAFDTAETFVTDKLNELHNVSEISQREHLSSSPFKTTAEPPSKAKLNLPKISLPQFDGNRASWTNFRDLFTSMIHNSTEFSKTQKMQYLKCSLTGEAASLVCALSIDDASYDAAWQALKDQYENRRLMISSILNKLFSIPDVSLDNILKLKELRSTVRVVLDSLQSVGVDTKGWDPLLVHSLLQKFNSSLRKDWESKLEDLTEYPTYKRFDAYLNQKICILEALNLDESKSSKDSSRPSKSEFLRFQKSDSKFKTVHTSNQPSKSACILCSQEHWLHACPKFNKMDVSERHKFRKEKNLCTNCLFSTHGVKNCKTPYRCKKCGNPHHTLLHFEAKKATAHNQFQKSVQQTPPTEINAPANSPAQTNDTLNVHLSAATHKNVLLATALVCIRAPCGRSATVRALIDPCSESSFVSQSVTQTLRLPRHRESGTHFAGLGGKRVAAPLKFLAQFQVAPREPSCEVATVRAYVMQDITAYVPKSFSPSNYPQLRNLQLADPEPTRNLRVEALLGADVYRQIILEGLIKLDNSEVVAQNTIFGWIFTGPTESTIICHHISRAQDDPTDALRKFWEIEDFQEPQKLSLEDDFCEQFFLQTTSQNDSGRFVVRLPLLPTFQEDQVAESKHVAMATWNRLEKRFASNDSLKKQYNEFLSEYETLGHMTEISHDQTDAKPRVFLPHHAVFREDSLTSKIRVVFNASSKMSNGLSINDLLCTGQKLQLDIFAIISNWRRHRFVIAADIVKMFRQILVAPQDRRFQNILWRKPGQAQVSEFELNTVTYGTKPAPFLANRVIKHLIHKLKDEFPLALEPLTKSIYVDDVLFGADDLDQACQIRDQVEAVLLKGQFPLQKWKSNHPDLIPQSNQNSDKLLLESPEFGENKVLGVSWCPISDTFKVRINCVNTSIITKRSILSKIAQIFDPLGWFSPVVIRAKTLIQLLWLKRLDWDEPVGTEIESRWLQFCHELRDLEQVAIPRWVGITQDTQKVSLVGFSDASSTAYSAAVYVYVWSDDGVVQSHLLIAKSKVAPVKTVSIPRLELCGATLLANLMASVRDSWSGQIDDILCYTDSTIVLDWLSKQPSTWVTFVANRISTIQTVLNTAKWRHISTKFNPADLNSRGLTVQSLLNSHLWWHGPEVIPNNSVIPSAADKSIINSACRKTATSVMVAHGVSEHDPLVFQSSSWSKTLRVTALIFKFVNLLKRKSDSYVKGISYSLDESTFEQAKNYIISSLQNAAYKPEIKNLQAGKPLAKSSTLLKLNPFLDTNQILRVGGRLQFSALPYSTKHPVILPHCSVTRTLIREVHQTSLHSGVQLTLQILRQTYWIVRGRQAVKLVINKCVTCTRQRANLESQQMSPLPAERCSEAPPFSHVGVDYAGPFNVREFAGRGQRSHKCYLAVFVCFTTKAAHLEIVDSYSTPAFLAALRRFISRCGLPDTIYSDQGTNFKGADAELKRIFKSHFENPDVHNSFANDAIKWQFIPPAAPHWGGLWEACVKSVKYHLTRVIGPFTPTKEEMLTIVAQIEACLNSRPLTPLHDDPLDEPALTPSLLFKRKILKVIPERSTLDFNADLLTRWQTTSKIVDSFWQKFRKEYLSTLQTRAKWHYVKEPIQIDDVVLLRNPNLPPSNWGLARVTALHPGKDGLVRSVTLKTAKTELERPISQICKLPTEQSNQTV